MRINCTENNIYISNQGENFEKSEELRTVIKFLNPSPVLNIFEDNTILLTIRIDTLKENPDLTNQYLHCSIRVLPNSGVMIDGIISQSPTEFLDWKYKDYEAVRIQPFFLSNKKELNKVTQKIRTKLESVSEEKPGLWANIRAKKARGEEPAHGNSNAHKDAVAAGKKIKK